MEPFKHIKPDQIETMVNSIDRTHRISHFYSSLSLSEAKQRAKNAFAAYNEAFVVGDIERAEAARQRFLAASERLKGNAS